MKQTRFLVYTNDALALVLGGFSLPIQSWKTQSQRQEDISARIERTTFKIDVLTSTRLTGKNPKDNFFSVRERLSKAPSGYTWKITELNVLFDMVEDAHILEFKKDTIHPAFFLEEHQTETSRNIRNFWDSAQEECAAQGVSIGNFKRSMLVLESVDGDEDKASDDDFLYLLMSHVKNRQNPLALQMYDIVYRVNVKRGAYEYQSRPMI